jgi:ribonuclease HI
MEREWKHEENKPAFEIVGAYLAWAAGSSNQYRTAMAYRVQSVTGYFVHEPPPALGDTNDNDSRAQMAGLIRAIEAIPPGSSLEFRSHNQYVCNTVNEYLYDWKSRGWKNKQGKSPENMDMILRLDRLLNERGTRVFARHIPKSNCNDSSIIARLRDYCSMALANKGPFDPIASVGER